MIMFKIAPSPFKNLGFIMFGPKIAPGSSYNCMQLTGLVSFVDLEVITPWDLKQTYSDLIIVIQDQPCFKLTTMSAHLHQF